MHGGATPAQLHDARSEDSEEKGERQGGVQTGNIVYGLNRAHGLHWIGKEGPADAVEGNQCHGPTNSIDC